MFCKRFDQLLTWLDSPRSVPNSFRSQLVPFPTRPGFDPIGIVWGPNWIFGSFGATCNLLGETCNRGLVF